jgi:hypothetical protein
MYGSGVTMVDSELTKIRDGFVLTGEKVKRGSGGCLWYLSGQFNGKEQEYDYFVYG